MHGTFLSSEATQGPVPGNIARQQARYQKAYIPILKLGFPELLISEVVLDSMFQVRIFHSSGPVAAPMFFRRQSNSDILHGVLRRPLSCCAIVPDSIRLEQLRNVRNQRVVRIGVRQQRANTQQNLTNRQCWTPLVLENVETNSAVRVDVTVIDACGKVDFGRLQRHGGERSATNS
jgi:hypothetical protein